MQGKLNRAILHSVFGRLAVYISQLLSLMICSRIFTPEDFGIIASISVFLIFFQLIADIGIGPALVNQPEISDDERNGIFSFTLIFGVIVGLIFYGFSNYLSLYYDNDVYGHISFVISVAIPFNCFNIVTNTAFVKDQKFLMLAKLETVAQLFSLILTLIMFVYTTPIISLASRMTSNAALKFILTWYYSRQTSLGRPHIGTEIKYIYKIKNFTLYQFGFGVINYFSRNLDDILIAKFINPAQLGVYNQAYQLMKYPLQLTSFAMGSAIQSVLTKHRDNIEYIVSEHNILARKLFIISIPIALYFYFNSDLIVSILLGSQWGDVGVLLKILSYSIPIQMVIATSGAFYQSINRPDLLFKSGFVGAVIFISSITISIFFLDIKITALSVNIAFTINAIVIYYILFKYGFKTSAREFVKTLCYTSYKMAPSVIAYCVFNQLYGYFNLEVNIFAETIISVLMLLFSAMIGLNYFRSVFMRSKRIIHP